MIPPDVPVHRERVGAMGVAAVGSEYPAPYTFKPYVYRGTGKDTLTGHEPKQHVAPEPDLAPEQWVDPLPARPVRSAPRWRPTSDAEIERMLAELEDA